MSKDGITKTPATSIFALISRVDLTLAAKTSVLLASTIALYFQDLIIVFNDAFNDEATSYILLIPVIFVFLIYRKRKMLAATISTKPENPNKTMQHYATLSGILLCATSIVLYSYGSYTFTPLEYHVMTLPLFVAGLTLTLFNLQTLRQAIFPIAFLFFLIPPPSEIFYGFGSILSVFSSEAATAIVRTLGVPATLTGEFGTPAIIVPGPDGQPIKFLVDVACSGIYGLIGFLVFAAFVAFIIRDKTWKKTVAFAIGFPLIYLLNLVRITSIVMIGYHIGEQLALDLFHVFGGWVLIFIGTLLLLLITDGILKTKIFRSKTEACTECGPNKTTAKESCSACGRITKHSRIALSRYDLIKIIALSASVMLLLWIQTPVFAAGLTPAPLFVTTPDGQQGNTEILPTIPGYDVNFVLRDTDFEKAAKQDFSLIYSYSPTVENKAYAWVSLEIASTTTSLHRWETCLVTWPETHGYQPKVSQLELRDQQILDNPPIIARFFAFQYLIDNRIQLVLYWYENNIFTVDNTTQQKNVKISLITYPATQEDIPRLENQLLSVAEEMAQYWQPIKTWASVSMFLSQDAPAIVTVTAVALAATIILYILEIRKNKIATANAYSKLGGENKQLINAIRETRKHSVSNLENVRKTYQTITGRQVSQQEFENKILELSRTDIARRDIANVHDEPVTTWKT